jgi:amphiphysin
VTSLETQDADFNRLENEFTLMEKDVSLLLDDVWGYRNALMTFVNHHYLLGEHLFTVHSKVTDAGPSALDGGIASIIRSASTQQINAVHDYKVMMGDISDALVPLLERMQSEVIDAVQQLQTIVHNVRNAIHKRHRKHLDYDRHVDAMNKLKAKQQLDKDDSRKIGMHDVVLREAQQTYDALNNQLKLELPQLFTLKSTFVQAIGAKFSTVQLNVYTVFVDHFKRFMELGFYDLSVDALDGYVGKSQQMDMMLASLSSLHAKRASASRLSVLGGQRITIDPLSETPAPMSSPTRETPPSLPPVYTPDTKSRMAVALFDFEAQSEEDL